VLLSRTNLSSANPQHSLGIPKSVLNPNQIGGYTSSRAGASLGSGNQMGAMVHHKIQQSSKTNLHGKQMHVIVEDKENRRDLVNR
jgi:hypothetical protein